MARKTKRKRKGKQEGVWARLMAWLDGPVADPPSRRSRREEARSDHVQEIKGLALFGLSLWLCVSMASYYRPIDDPAASGLNWGGQVGFYLADVAYMATGIAGLLFAALGMAWGLVLVARKRVAWPALRGLSALCFVVSVSFLIELGFGDPGRIDAGLVGSRMPYGPGGWLALQATPVLVQKFGAVGLWILMVLLALTSFMLATEMAFWPALSALAEWARSRREERGESLLSAVGGWLRQLAVGLWNFVRGAALDEPLAPAEASGSASTKPARPTRKAAAVPRAEEEDEEEEEEEYEEEAVSYTHLRAHET